MVDFPEALVVVWVVGEVQLLADAGMMKRAGINSLFMYWSSR